MVELELTEEERLLLAEADDAPNPVITEPVPVADDGEIVEPPPIADEPPKVVEPLLEAGRRQARRGRARLPEQPAEQPVVAAEGQILPDEGNSTAPPAQYDYGDPWGRLPTQMRHLTDGTPAF